MTKFFLPQKSKINRFLSDLKNKNGARAMKNKILRIVRDGFLIGTGFYLGWLSYIVLTK